MKCIWHPWATDQEGFCWKCEESRGSYINGETGYRQHLVRQEQRIDQYNEYMKTVERPKDDITWDVIQDLTSRAERGLAKYNTTLEENNHQNMLQHAYEEALDLAQYLKKEIKMFNTIQDLVAKYPNDMELGKKVRGLCRGKK